MSFICKDFQVESRKLWKVSGNWAMADARCQSWITWNLIKYITYYVITRDNVKNVQSDIPDKDSAGEILARFKYYSYLKYQNR